MKRIFIIGLSLSTLFSCGDSEIKSQNGEIASAVAANGDNEEDLKASLAEIEKEEQDRIKMEGASATTMSFDKLVHNFGIIKEETDNNASFIVTNTGKNPLIIDKVDVSCGCTTAKKPEKPIAPGKSDRIEVVFHPKVGQLKEQKKTVTVTANTEPKIVVLNIEAFVEE
jgi:ABC-type sugar transport system ATPase subunit